MTRFSHWKIAESKWISDFNNSAAFQVYQRIAAYSSRLDNTVELYSTINFPSIPGFPKSEPIVTTVNLKHQFEAVGGSSVKISYEETEVKSSGTFPAPDLFFLNQVVILDIHFVQLPCHLYNCNVIQPVMTNWQNQLRWSTPYLCVWLLLWILTLVARVSSLVFPVFAVLSCSRLLMSLDPSTDAQTSAYSLEYMWKQDPSVYRAINLFCVLD